jgi:superfamily II DNA or RNA helicase
VQYAGRLHRLHDQKSAVIIYDYADLAVPTLARMHERRLRGYRAIGYKVEGAPGD